MILSRSLTAFLAAMLALAIAPLGAAEARAGGAAGARTVVTTSWVEEWDPAAQRWVRVADSPAAVLADAVAVSRSSSAAVGAVATETILVPGAAFTIPGHRLERPGAQPFLAQYGPFRVLDEKRAALVAATDILSPRHFEAMLRDYPGLAVLEMVDAPGTSHDLANLALGRKIRAAGLETHVPAGGSVRSGAVELFLAGTRQTIAPGARFAVHSWMDTRGLEPRHFAEDAPENRLYLDYYEEMGMMPDHARAFYAMTNSVPHSGALWLDAAAMERWIAPLSGPLAPIRTIAAADEPENEGAGAGEGTAAVVFADAMPAEAAAAPAPVLTPVLVWFEPAVVTLARLDSAAVFP
ncbi:MAG: hypothetical protein ACK4IS_10890 [Erythrobacter sp.]